MFSKIQSANIINIKLFRKTALLKGIAKNKPKLQTVSITKI